MGCLEISIDFCEEEMLDIRESNHLKFYSSGSLNN